MADTVAVLVPPGSGDDVQMLKAGILEIADLFVVNKADLEGAHRTVQELKEMIQYRDGGMPARVGHHGASAGGFDRPDEDTADGDDEDAWVPPIVEAVAKDSEGVQDVLDALGDHREHLATSGELETQARMRYAEEIRTLLREDTSALLEAEIEHRGGLDQYAERVRDRETDPYSVSDELLAPLEECLEENRE
jgi:LAO/AO transport system kinase